MLFGRTFRPRPSRNLLRLIGALLFVVVAFTVLYGGHSADIVHSILASSKLALVLSGLLAATFVGQEIVVPLVRPFAKALAEANEDLNKVEHTSAYIG
jgi:hypothetical protein